jgi:hypothetical protein
MTQNNQNQQGQPGQGTEQYGGQTGQQGGQTTNPQDEKIGGLTETEEDTEIEEED